MEKYSLNTLREMFLEFFESKGHLRLNSFSLIPNNDNSLLLINSGMAPLKPYFTGALEPPRRRVTTCQKCIRTGDIENVGKTSRHGTFFEMLGNFSFGDYFKEEAITWSWEFLTKVVGLDPNRLYPSVYLDDDEAFNIWHEKIGISKDRIFKFGKEDNFWEHGAGPCGPCSEIYYDRGEKYGCDSPNCTVGCDCDRYIEVWNNVFTQFENDGNGNYTELIQKNIDTGMGLERLATIVQDVDSIFDVDTVRAIRDKVAELGNIKYNENSQKDVSIRLITDHIRSSTFMISDGIMPTNEGRGYVLRRLIRRAVRHGRLLNINESFLSILALDVINISKGGYKELEDKKDFILKVLEEEEDRFNQTLDQGLNILNSMVDDLKTKVLSGDQAFKLYDTYGFPLELTREILDEKGITIDEEGFKAHMENQRQMARSARKVSNYMGADETVYDKLDPKLSSVFVGYDKDSIKAKIISIVGNDDILDTTTEGELGIITDETVFYPTMGGQVGDHGKIISVNGEFSVRETIKLGGDRIVHIGNMLKGSFSLGETVELFPDMNNRKDTCKNHSATHLLHKALKEVLGSHVEQKGSYVSNDRLRFDFSHFAALTNEEIQKVEDLVNQEIAKSYDVVTRVMDIEEAKKEKATALFGEKYSQKVRVVSMGEFSKELCGGTHVKNVGSIRELKILSESGISSGVRRIEAITGDNVSRYYKKLENDLNDIASMFKCDISALKDKLSALKDENKKLINDNEKLKNEMARMELGNIDDKIIKIAELDVLVLDLGDADMASLRGLSDDMKNKLKDYVIVFAGRDGEKVSLFATCSKSAVDKGINCKDLIQGIAGFVKGGGGGKVDSAQAGGKDKSGISLALDKALNLIKEALNE